MTTDLTAPPSHVPRHAATARGSSTRSLWWASLIGAVASLPFFGFLLSQGFSTLRSSTFSSNFYDVQASQILHGRLSVPTSVAGPEGILTAHGTYLYFGPFLALLRLPVIWLFPTASGRLTQCSMALAFALLLLATSFIGIELRRLLRGDLPIRTAELVVHAMAVFCVGAGSVATFLAAWSSVYDETELWGAALGLSAIAGFLVLRTRPSLGAAVVLGLATWAGLLTRESVALGSVALVVLALVLGVLDARGQRRRAPRTATLLVLAGILLAAITSVVAINLVKFDTLLSVPFQHQGIVTDGLGPSATRFYAHHQPTFSLAFLPTTLRWYLLPWALHVSDLVPFVGFTNHISVVGGQLFEALTPSSSMTATMPLAFVAAATGVLGLLFSRRTDRSGRATVLWALGSAAISGGGVLVFSTIANRYLADFLPLLVLGGLVGMLLVIGWLDAAPPALRWAVAVLAVVLLVISVFVNLALGIQQRTVIVNGTTLTQRASALSTALSIQATLPFVGVPSIASTDQLPSDPQIGQLAILGRCDELAQYDAANWKTIELGGHAGHARLAVDLAGRPVGWSWPLLVSGSQPDARQSIRVVVLSGRRFALAFDSAPLTGLLGHPVVVTSAPMPIGRGPVIVDALLGGAGGAGSRVAQASVDGDVVLDVDLPIATAGPWSIGHKPGQTTTSAAVRPLRVTTPLCDQLVARAP